MQVSKSVRQQSCVDGSVMRVLILDTPVSREFLDFLGRFGTLVVLDDSDCSFFSFTREKVLCVMGFLNDPSIEVKYPKEYQDITRDVFERVCSLYRDGAPDLESLGAMGRSLDEKIRAREGRI